MQDLHVNTPACTPHQATTMLKGSENKSLTPGLVLTTAFCINNETHPARPATS
jgi:hypothetical protein